MSFSETILLQLGPANAGQAANLAAQLVNPDGTNQGSPVTSGFETIGNGDYSWTYASFPDGWRGIVKFAISGAYKASSAVNPDSGFGGALPTAVTIQFRDGGGAAIGSVQFVVLNVGSGTADGAGNAVVDLAAGAYTIRSLPQGGLLFADTAVTVAGSTQTVTITGATGGSGVTPAPDPGQTNAFLTTRDAQGTAVPAISIWFSLIDPQAATDAFDQSPFSATSDGSGLLTVPLRKGSTYEARTAKGKWVPFTTGSAATYALPEVLGLY